MHLSARDTTPANHHIAVLCREALSSSTCCSQLTGRLACIALSWHAGMALPLRMSRHTREVSPNQDEAACVVRKSRNADDGEQTVEFLANPICLCTCAELPGAFGKVQASGYSCRSADAMQAFRS